MTYTIQNHHYQEHKKAHLGQTPSVILEIFKILESERALRTPNNIKPLLNTVRIHNELPHIWNSLEANLKGHISLTNLLNNIKIQCIKQYNEFKCENNQCYTCTT